MSESVKEGAARTLDAELLHDQKKYLAFMRHELRTPINAIIGYSEMLMEDAADQALNSLMPYLERAHAAGKQLLLLVNDFLEQGKVDAGLADLKSETYRNTLNEALRPSIETAIAATKDAIREVNTLQETSMLADLERISSASERFLGLVDELLAYEMQEGGPVESPQPASAESVEPLPARASVAEDEAGQPTEHGLVLIVDDNEANRDMLSRRLVRQGHTVVMAENGRRALDLVKKTNFDLVLLDILMPEVNGYEVLKRLKADEATRDIPVIMISALDEIDSVVRCIEMGAEDYLPKPFNPVLLRARIGASLEKKRFRDQEVAYLKAVSQVTASAAAMEANEFDPVSLDEVAARSDALGALGRVFQNMAREVIAREQRLRQQLQELKIEIDDVKKEREVAEITETDYFKTLQEKAQRMREKRNSEASAGTQSAAPLAAGPADSSAPVVDKPPQVEVNPLTPSTTPPPPRLTLRKRKSKSQSKPKRKRVVARSRKR